jgi:mannose-6-phosphate isomerase-like protein (cupin superfamily)
MLGWVDDVERATLENTDFRRVLFTGRHTQLTVMRLAPGEEIGLEVHDNLDQFIRIEQGTARITFGRSKGEIDEEHEVEADWAVIVPSGVWHNVTSIGTDELKLYSLYSPPEHPSGTIHHTKADVDAARWDH